MNKAKPEDVNLSHRHQALKQKPISNESNIDNMGNRIC